MKTVGINNEFTDFAGNAIMGVDGPLTYSDILTQCMGAFFISENAKENILARKVGQKIHDADGSVELEDAEFDLLNKAVKNALTDKRYTAMVMGPICELMESMKG